MLYVNLIITERIRKCLDKGEFAGGVFVDTKGL